MKTSTEGQLLSETDTGVDYLEASVYANAIAESIHDATTSITIGIYAKWGSGKSFLLKHIESVLRRFQNQDEEDSGPDVGAKYGCSKSKRLFCWTLALLSVFGLIVFTAIMAADPAFYFPPLPVTNLSNSAVTTTVPASTTTVVTSQEVQRMNDMNTVKIVGWALFPIELILLIVIALFGVWPTARRTKGKMEILSYAMFTKIPIQRDQLDIVEDPGESPDEMLQQVKPGNELLAMATTSSVRFPRRYIFVNFKAWEYAGSDTLWAAIVMNISDAIEAEFGAVTTRLFRTIAVTEVSKKHLGKFNTSLYVQFTSGTSDDDIRNLMKRYGVVTRVRQVSGSSTYRWHEVTYATDGEFRNAKDSLTVEGFEVLTTAPSDEALKGSPTKDTPPADPNNEPMLRNNGKDDEIIMQGDSPAKMEAVSTVFCCCRRFCTHFVRYPVTLCKLPRLYWWIILLAASVLIPITAYIVADLLNFRTEQTWRAVPQYVQVLLWLPGPVSVVVFALKFGWAMCRSQKRRINKALNGIEGKMASELGFMSTVKDEVEVMTRLIRCARFVLQKDYRVIITIDDLDQVSLKKVHSVLEAVSILLSDKSSPFFCLIAADLRIIEKSVENNLGKVLKKADVSGREYIKKIVNLPVCLPELNEPIKKRFIAGLIDQSDATINYTKEHTKKAHEGESRPGEDVAEGGQKADPARTPGESRSKGESRHEEDVAEGGHVADSESADVGRKEFLFECRRCMYENADLRRHIHGNARNMKRIFNVVSLTCCLINSIVKRQNLKEFMHKNMKGGDSRANMVEGFPKIVRTKELAEKLVHWLVLVDEWPYRTSFIVQVIHNADQREVAGLSDTKIPDDWDILKIYIEKVQKHFLVPDGTLDTLDTLDGDPDLFQTYLLWLGSHKFNKSDILLLMRLTINLDSSIRRRIALKLAPPPIRHTDQPSRDDDCDDVATPTTSMHTKKNKTSSGGSDDTDGEEDEAAC